MNRRDQDRMLDEIEKVARDNCDHGEPFTCAKCKVESTGFNFNITCRVPDGIIAMTLCPSCFSEFRRITQGAPCTVSAVRYKDKS